VVVGIVADGGWDVELAKRTVAGTVTDGGWNVEAVKEAVAARSIQCCVGGTMIADVGKRVVPEDAG
jgi:hypothetical protein